MTVLATALPIGLAALVSAVAASVAANLIWSFIPEPRRRLARGIAIVVVLAIALTAAVISAVLTAPQTPHNEQHSRTPIPTSPAPIPTASDSSSALPSTTEQPDATLLYSQQAISLPGGGCGGSTVATFDDSGKPTVSVDVATLLNDSTKWDLELTDCPGTTQYLKPSHAQLSDQVAPDTTAAGCIAAVAQNPAAANPQPADGSNYCLATSNGLVVLINVVHVAQKPYDAHLLVTAWLITQ